MMIRFGKEFLKLNHKNRKLENIFFTKTECIQLYKLYKNVGHKYFSINEEDYND